MRLALVFIACLMLAFGTAAIAQTNGFSEIQEEAANIKVAARILDRISGVAGSDDESLVGARVKYQNLITDTADIIRRIDEQAASITTRLEEIGPPPDAEGVTEPATITETRNQLNQDRAALVVLKTELETIQGSARQAISRITQTRQQAFTEAISRQTEFTPDSLREATGGLSALAVSLRSLASNWFSFLVSDRLWQTIASAAISLIVAIALSMNFNRFFGTYLDRITDHPDYFTRVFTAFWASVLPSLATAVFLAAFYALFSYFDLLPTNVARIMLALLLAIGGLVFAWNLCRAVYSPREPTWRLAAINDQAARRLFFLTLMMFAIYAFDAVFTEVNAALSGPVTLTALQGLVASYLMGGTLLFMGLSLQSNALQLRSASQASKDVSEDSATAPAIPAREEDSGFSFWRLLTFLFQPRRVVRAIRILLYVSAALIIISALLGYIGFARFIAQQIVVSGAIVAAMIIGLQAGRELSREGVMASTRVGRLLLSKGTDPYRVEQLSLLAGITIILAVLAIGIPAILTQWGTRTEEIFAFFGRLFTGIDIGNIRISLGGILIGIAVFFIALGITRLFKGWLNRSVFTRSKIDPGVRDSITAGVGYTGFAIAALLAITSAGFDLSSLAIVAGALSLGIGFGLQNVVSNFVSGLILLVERPIKVGDWIVVGAAEGTVKRISVRATEIETFQRQSIIVPNSELINSQVGNWTFKSKSGRVDILIGVAYGSDVRQVEKILYELADSHPMVLKRPEPKVFFLNFGDFSLDFRLQMFLADISNTMTVQTEMRFQILERFAEAGIEIPFPRRDLNIKLESDSSEGVEVGEALLQAIEASEGDGGPPPKSTARSRAKSGAKSTAKSRTKCSGTKAAPRKKATSARETG